MTTREPISIENGRVEIHAPENRVWLTRHQIADLFGVFVPAVGSNIRSILKSGILTPADFQQPGQFLVGDEPLSLECPASGGFQFIQCLAGLFQAPEEIRHTRIVLVDEIMAHNAAVLG